MATPKAAWGMEIGAHAIKAVRLEREGDRVTVSDFAVIPHKRVLTTPDLDQNEMIRLSLGQFISQKSLEGERLVMSVPGHAAFARFAKLPPVEPRKVPDIVKFEAVQQIPFPIDEVEWDYQTFTSEDSPEVEVGIFAITRERVQQRLNLYAELGITPEALTLSPVAVYNAMHYDFELPARKRPVVFLDIGTQATDVIVVEEGRCWIRTFPLGGTHFTEAIANSFKLSYSKAEKLKKEAATSKYAKQIMQAMRPVFSDLLQDLQRSIGYYNSMHREHELSRMVGIGSTFKIPGLRKFLGQQLQINVVRLDEYKKIAVTGREAAAFAENAVNMATAYGLALQGVGLASISANLVPVKALRDQMWHAKTKWFAAAAAIVIVGAAMTLYRPLTDGGSLAPGEGPPVVNDVIQNAKRIKEQYEQLQTTGDIGSTTQNIRQLVKSREIWPHLVNDVATALNATGPQRELLTGDPEQVQGIPPGERRLVRLDLLSGEYVSGGADGPRRINVTVAVELSHNHPGEFLNETVEQWLRDNAERPGVPYRILTNTISHNPTLLETIRISEGGEESASGGGGSGATPPGRQGSGSPAPSAPGATRPSAPGTSGRSPGMPGRRRPPGERRTAPGVRSGGGGISTGGSTPSGIGPSGPTAPAAPSAPGARPPWPGGRGDGGGKSGDLDELAPMPEKPEFYEPGATYYRLPITFTIELVEPKPAAVPSQASAQFGQEDLAS